MAKTTLFVPAEDSQVAGSLQEERYHLMRAVDAAEGVYRHSLGGGAGELVLRCGRIGHFRACVADVHHDVAERRGRHRKSARGEPMRRRRFFAAVQPRLA